jgi:GT2 family glycosyltransferase
VSLLIIDNASVDGTVMWLKEHAPHLPILQNTRNLGFSRAHNQAILLTQAPYILVLNPDVVLQPTWVEQAVRYMDEHPECGALGGKTVRYHYTHDDLKEVEESGIIDSTGFLMHRSRYCTDRGAGEKDSGQYNQAADVFGISGSCLMLRRTALNEIRFKDEYFDEDFFAYKEDIDLAWRLQRRGWRIRYEPALIALHHREIKAVATSNDFFLARNHQQRSQRISYLSLRNHYLLLMKHERPATFWRDALHICWQECKKIGFLLLTQPKVLVGIRDALRLSKKMKAKASVIDHQAKRPALDIRTTYFLSN